MEKKKLAHKAIEAALSSDWLKAVSLNQEILENSPEDIDALNRLGYAFLKLGKTKKAKSNFKKVLKLERYNSLALKNLEKLQKIKKIKTSPKKIQISPSLFLRESGESKTIVLVETAPQEVLSSLATGQPVNLHLKGHSIEVRTDDKTYLGAIPDDVSFELKKLIKTGCQYTALVKDIRKNYLSIFLRLHLTSPNSAS